MGVMTKISFAVSFLKALAMRGIGHAQYHTLNTSRYALSKNVLGNQGIQSGRTQVGGPGVSEDILKEAAFRAKGIELQNVNRYKSFGDQGIQSGRTHTNEAVVRKVEMAVRDAILYDKNDSGKK